MMSNDNYGVIQEMGDYGNFTLLNRNDNEAAKRLQEKRRRSVNEQVSYDGGQVRLGDCSHLDR
jgi:hypothetical protein